MSFHSLNDYTYIDLDEKANDLLTNPEFILLRVPNDGETMKLVRPAEDPQIQEGLREYWHGRLPYYALSHLWGIPNEEEKQKHMWDVGSFIRDENDDPVAPIPMRKEKRGTLLRLLQQMGPSCERQNCSYWWIDVLCARVTTPLGIMGGIYAHCKICYAMIDCKSRTLRALSYHDEFEEMQKDYANIKKIEKSWAKDSHARRYRSFVEKWSEPLQLVHQLTQCKWFKRVWTWQEATLPLHTYLIPERSGKGSITDYTTKTNCFTWTQSWSDLKSHHVDFALPKDTAQRLKAISSAWREIYKAHDYRRLTDSYREPSIPSFINTVASLGDSTRICMDPVDYVYGVLGILDLDVDRIEDPQLVWKSFLTKLEDLIEWVLSYRKQHWWIKPKVESISISDKAYQVDLSTARNMADVYSGLLDVTYEDMSEEADEDTTSEET